MKKFIIGVIIILTALMGCQTVKAQNYSRDNKTFVATKTTSDFKPQDIATSYTWRDSKGVEYPIYLHKYTKGENEGKYGAYVIKKSAKTGNDYKYYIPSGLEIANEIKKEMGLK